MKPKVIAMYLPQYHETEVNSRFWGEGYTDWCCVKNSKKYIDGQIQPKVPLNKNYYDLSDKNAILKQIDLAKRYGVYGFGIYHYWFNDDEQALQKPAEIILEDKNLDIPFFFAWDNSSWKRTWDNVPGNDWAPLADSSYVGAGEGVLLQYRLGDESSWIKHYEYLSRFFIDDRYIKIDNKPIFVIWNYSSSVDSMIKVWNELAQENGFDGVYVIFQHNPRLKVPMKYKRFIYEPAYTAWGDYISRGKKKIKRLLNIDNKVSIYDYDKIWGGIIKRAQCLDDANLFLGGFVNYDDTPRRGVKGSVILSSNPKKFNRYIKRLLKIAETRNDDLIFLTAWNEWGEGAYLEPDETNGYAYLEALKAAIDECQAEK